MGAFLFFLEEKIGDIPIFRGPATFALIEH
jgi:hypothetical protein